MTARKGTPTRWWAPFDVNGWLLFAQILGACVWTVCALVPDFTGRDDRFAVLAPWAVAGLAVYAVVMAVGMARLHRAVRNSRKETRP